MDIVVLYGGRSPERLISEVSSRQIAEALTTDNVIRLNLNGIYNFENKEQVFAIKKYCSRCK